MKNLIQCLLMLLFVGLITNVIGQNIPENFFGQNSWYTVYTDDGQSTAANDHFVNNIQEVKNSGAKFVRIGGAAANIFGNTYGNNVNPITKEQVLFLVKKIRAAGMEPIIQVPYPNDLNDNDNTELSNSAVNAAEMVEFINITNAGSIGGRVDSWIIANEPDKNLDANNVKIGYNYHAGSTNSPTEIAKYIKQFAIKMREKDPNIKIIGPELSEYLHHFFFGDMYNSIDFTGFGLLEDGSVNDISGLIGATDVFGNATLAVVQGKPYIDYVSVHYYPPSSSTAIVTDELHDTSDDWKLKKGLININNALPNINANRSGYPLKIAITEANIEKGTYGPSTFIGGQWWADFASVCLSQNVDMLQFWSSFEDDYGFVDYSANKRSSYWHYKLLADHFAPGSTYNTTFYPTTSTLPSNIKAFGAKVDGSNQAFVMILNQNESGPRFFYEINRNGSTGNINFSMTGQPDEIKYGDILPQSTHVVMFNCNGEEAGKWVYNFTKNSNDEHPEWIPAEGANKPFTLTYNPLLSSVTVPSCPSFATITVSGADQYSFVYTAPNFQPTGNPGEFTVCREIDPTEHFIIATDVNGCKVIEKIIVDEDLATSCTTPNFSTSDASCAGNYQDGSITIHSSHCGYPPGHTFTGFSPGQYTWTFTCSDGGGGYCDFTYVINFNEGEFFQQKIIQNNIYWNNSGKVAGNVEIENGGKLLINSPLLEAAPGTKFIVKNGGEMVINASTLRTMASCSGSWGIEVQPGGKLFLRPGSNVEINGNGKIDIQTSSSAKGELFYSSGASIVLKDAGSVLEIAGRLHVNSNTTFTIHQASSRLGMVRMHTGAAITAGVNSEVFLRGFGKGNKVLEVAQGVGNVLVFPSSLEKAMLLNTGVEIKNGASISFESEETKIVFVNAFASNQTHITLGSDHTVVEHSNFNKVRLIGVNTSNGLLRINASEIKNSVFGLGLFGNGAVSLSHTDIHNNEIGIYTLTNQNLHITGGNIYNNTRFGVGEGIEAILNFGSQISLEKTNIYSNPTGVKMYYGGAVSIRCGKVTENETGIELYEGANLSMTTQEGGGYVDMRNNSDLAIFTDAGDWIYMDDGFNNFDVDHFEDRCTVSTVFVSANENSDVASGFPDKYGNNLSAEVFSFTTATCPPVVEGTLLDTDFNYVMEAGNNYWPEANISGTGSIQNSNGISYQPIRLAWCQPVTQFGGCLPVPFSANTTPELQEPETCPVTGAGGVVSEPFPAMRCAPCRPITTDDFLNEKLNQALKFTLEAADRGIRENSHSKTDTALDLFHQLLTYPMPQMKKEEKKVLDVAYRQMQRTLRDHIAIDSTFKNNKPAHAACLAKVEAAMNTRISRSISDGNYFDRFHTSMDKAQFYRLINERQTALSELNAIRVWAVQKDIEKIDALYCVIEAEIAVDNGTLEKYLFHDHIVANCLIPKNTGSSLKKGNIPEAESVHPSDPLVMNIMPNPAREQLRIELQGQKEPLRLTIWNKLGQQVYQSRIQDQLSLNVNDWKKGMYFILLHNSASETVKTGKIMVQ